MVSLSKSDFAIIGFLIRNFHKKYTIRDVASNLKISAPGAHAALKKLESEGIVKAEKLGTGLFYEVAFERPLGKHVAAIALLSGEGKDYGLSKAAKAALFDGKTILAIAQDQNAVKDAVFRQNAQISVVCKNEDEFKNALLAKDADVLGILKNSKVLFGEEMVIEAIRQAK
ncbi:helix-turn-helix transcriptional regulator [Candidatus Woesearchaeota archaeon]|nr:helix-turn-helix transcriptional regulator [Candidatus Woesearchaeota archaeon]